MKIRHRNAVLAGWLGVVSLAGCSGDGGSLPNGGEGVSGTVGMELQIAPGITVNAVNWTVSNSTSGFTQSGTVNVKFSNTIQFQIGGLPSGSGYTITLTATSVDGTLACLGSAVFTVVPGTTSSVHLTLTCASGVADAGTIVVSGDTQLCANITSLSVAPLETTVGNPIALAATASAAGTVTPAFAWTATAGTFDNASSPSPAFTCPATPGTVTISVSVAPSGPACTTNTSQSVTVTCDTLNPTFTNVYANVIGARCTGCHHPGGSGVNVGGLDLSTQALAIANLVGVSAAGTGAGASGVTCSSVMPPLVRVKPSDSANSLIYNKVNSKLTAAPAPCGSPMPLPASAVPLTQAQVDLIKTWIDNGALND